MAALMKLPEQHEIIEEAMAATRFYRRYWASGGKTPERTSEIAEILREIGTKENGPLLVAFADIIEGA